MRAHTRILSLALFLFLPHLLSLCLSLQPPPFFILLKYLIFSASGSSPIPWSMSCGTLPDSSSPLPHLLLRFDLRRLPKCESGLSYLQILSRLRWEDLSLPCTSPAPILVEFYHIIVCVSLARLKALSRWDLVCLGFPTPSMMPGKKKVLSRYGGLQYGEQRRKRVRKEGTIK